MSASPLKTILRYNRMKKTENTNSGINTNSREDYRSTNPEIITMNRNSNRRNLSSEDSYATLTLGSSEPIDFTINLNPIPMTDDGSFLPGNITTLRLTYDEVRRLSEESTSLKGRDRIVIMKREAKNREIELFKQSNDMCPIDKLSYLRDRLGSLDSFEFNRLIKEKFYDPNIMASLMCVTESIFYIPNVEHGNMTERERLKTYFRDLQRIGSVSVEGVAMSSKLNPSDDIRNIGKPFVLKVPQDTTKDDLLHEAIIGIFGTNELRENVPNFAYIFGSTKCSTAFVEGDNVKSWCNVKDDELNVDYIIYENIEPSVTLKEYCENCTASQFLDKYLQILYALAIANNKIDFTHYDLHSSNVLIRTTNNNEFYIPYQNLEDDRTYYIKTDAIATIIDYGFSHIKHEGQSYGIYDRIHYGVQYERKFPIYDSFKLLLFSLENMKNNNNMDCFNTISKLVPFFNSTDSIDNIIKLGKDVFYYLPITESNQYITQYNLINYIEEVLPIEFSYIVTSVRPDGEIIGCNGTNICISMDETYVKLGVEMVEPMANSVIEFYDLVSRLSDRGDKRSVKRIKEDFKGIYDIAIQDNDIRINLLLSEVGDLFNKSMSNLKNYILTHIMRAQNKKRFINNLMTNSELLNDYKSNIYEIASYIDKFQELILSITAQLYIMDIYKIKDEYYDLLAEAKVRTMFNYNVFRDNAFRLIITDANSLQSLFLEDNYNKLITSYIKPYKKKGLKSKFDFWFTTLYEFAEMINTL